MNAAVPVPPYLAPGRDLRLDFFRGLALWFIYLDHVPDNIVSWFTVATTASATPPRSSSSSRATPR